MILSQSCHSHLFLINSLIDETITDVSTLTDHQVTTSPDQVAKSLKQVTNLTDQVLPSPDQVSSSPAQVTTSPDKVLISPDDQHYVCCGDTSPLWVCTNT